MELRVNMHFDAHSERIDSFSVASSLDAFAISHANDMQLDRTVFSTAAFDRN